MFSPKASRRWRVVGDQEIPFLRREALVMDQTLALQPPDVESHLVGNEGEDRALLLEVEMRARRVAGVPGGADEVAAPNARADVGEQHVAWHVHVRGDRAVLMLDRDVVAPGALGTFVLHP